jgi:hypothetical protein
MKRMAAYDFEDLLQVCKSTVVTGLRLNRAPQCALPVFEGLLPDPHNAAVMELLQLLCS